jgi:hypothetical protein
MFLLKISLLSEVFLAWWAIGPDHLFSVTVTQTQTFAGLGFFTRALCFVPLVDPSRNQDRGFEYGAMWCTMHHTFSPGHIWPQRKTNRSA